MYIQFGIRYTAKSSHSILCQILLKLLHSSPTNEYFIVSMFQ